MKKLLFSIFALALGFNAFAVTDPTSLKVKVYQIAVAENADCSDPQVIFTSTAGSEKDFITNPTLGSGSLADGTYNCVMITMDDVIKFTPLANDGATCTAGTEYAIDLCRVGEDTDLLESTTTTSTACVGTDQSVSAGGIANKVTLYLRTTSPANNSGDADDVYSWKKGTVLANANGAGNPSVDSANGIQLTTGFVVSGTKTGIFYVDASSQVTGAGANCEMNAPEFGFRDP